ncbi:MAG: ribosome-associated translation inhibitor RaiA [Candidatus Wildermuthbacteria bacterium]|nr:ribosome-associated translation inhibitor RaiA [Candidatus Wildermuthbacteria bacterium]
MILEIKETSVKLTPLLLSYIEKRFASLGRFVERYEKEGELQTFIEVAKTTTHHNKGNLFYVEVMVQLPKALVRAETTNEDFGSAVDIAKDIFKKELVKYKETHEWKLKRGM